MSNSSMNQINVSNPVIYRLAPTNFMLSFDISTETRTTALIDLSKNSKNETKIISSNGVYSKFKENHLSSRKNKNTGDIKFYSYAGGKEITRLTTGSNRMSNLAYPPYNGTLFSSIELPEMNKKDNVYLLIDNYIEINTISCPNMKKELINKDLEILLNKIKNGIEGKNVNFIILFDSKLHEELIKYEPELNTIICSYDIHPMKSEGHIVPYVCDLVFGRILGGQTHQFTGVINPEGYTIIDAFTTSIINYHKLTNRTSGLSILGNGTATIYMLLRSNNALTNKIKLMEVPTGTELLNISTNTNVKEHKNTSDILKLIKLIDYTLLLKNILSKNDRTEMKQFMKDNLEENFNWEFNFLENYNPDKLEEDIKLQIDNKMILYYQNMLHFLKTIRNIYSGKRSLDDLLDNYPPYKGEQTEAVYPNQREIVAAQTAQPQTPTIPNLKRENVYFSPPKNVNRELSCMNSSW